MRAYSMAYIPFILAIHPCYAHSMGYFPSVSAICLLFANSIGYFPSTRPITIVTRNLGCSTSHLTNSSLLSTLYSLLSTLYSLPLLFIPATSFHLSTFYSSPPQSPSINRTYPQLAHILSTYYTYLSPKQLKKARAHPLLTEEDGAQADFIFLRIPR
ncbi:hypothetical protein D3C73_940290 [compost metagenome]